jgi:hypothetical protein
MTALIRKFARLELPPSTSSYNVHPFMMESFANAQWNDVRNCTYSKAPVVPVNHGPYIHMTSGDEYKYWKELAEANYTLQHFMKPFKVNAFGTKNIKDASKTLMVRSWFRETPAGLNVAFFMERIDETDTIPGGYPELVNNHTYMPTSTDWNIMGQVAGWIQTSAPDKGLYDHMHMVSFKPATTAELV